MDAFVWKWYILLPIVLYHVVIPVTVFVFFCRCCKAPVKWLRCAGYVALSAGLTFLEYQWGLRGGLGLVLETGLLAWWGRVSVKKSWTETVALSVLLLSIHSVTGGLVSWMDQRVLAPIVTAHESLIHPSDGVREFTRAVSVLILFQVVVKKFRGLTDYGNRKAFLWMAIPVFFISLVERIIQNSIYGDNMVMDDISGTISSIIDINHSEMLFLQMFACACLFLALFAYERITGIFQEAQKLKLLKQQAQVQEVYIREAAMRYEQTRAFRHDIKNHLTVVAELLRQNQTEEAKSYLSQLENASDRLDGGVMTGNAAVDALLGSKLSLAGQEGIRTECGITIPGDSGIPDLDWCIVLSNAVDNAIKACREVAPENRCLKLESRKKGNFYLISIENSCSQALEQVPEDGTGLSNIRAVAETYNGRVENTVSHGIYRLKLLFVDLQQKKAV